MAFRDHVQEALKGAFEGNTISLSTFIRYHWKIYAYDCSILSKSEMGMCGVCVPLKEELHIVYRSRKCRAHVLAIPFQNVFKRALLCLSDLSKIEWHVDVVGDFKTTQWSFGDWGLSWHSWNIENPWIKHRSLIIRHPYKNHVYKKPVRNYSIVYQLSLKHPHNCTDCTCPNVPNLFNCVSRRCPPFHG